MRDLCDLLRRDDLAGKADAFELIEPVDEPPMRANHWDYELESVWLAEHGMHVYQVLCTMDDIDDNGSAVYEYVPLEFGPVQQKA